MIGGIEVVREVGCGPDMALPKIAITGSEGATKEIAHEAAFTVNGL